MLPIFKGKLWLLQSREASCVWYGGGRNGVGQFFILRFGRGCTKGSVLSPFLPFCLMMLMNWEVWVCQ